MKFKSVAAIAIFVIAAILFCFCGVMQSQLLINPWIPISICVFVGIVSTLAMWKVWVKLMPDVKVWLCCVYNVVVMTSVLLSAFYFTTILSCRDSQPEMIRAIITRVYREQHYRTRRVSRRVYTRGAPYWVYKADVRLPENGVDKSLRVDFKKYKIMHKGDTLLLPLRSSIFGIQVLDTSHIDYSLLPKPKKLRMTPRRLKRMYNL